MAKSEFTLAFNEITEAHHLPRQIVIDAQCTSFESGRRLAATLACARIGVPEATFAPLWQ